MECGIQDIRADSFEMCVLLKNKIYFGGINQYGSIPRNTSFACET